VADRKLDQAGKMLLDIKLVGGQRTIALVDDGTLDALRLWLANPPDPAPKAEGAKK
jgi:hypothetical protein